MQHDTLETVYDYLTRYVNEHGYPPSIREIAAACHSNPMSASSALDILEAQGRISRARGKARSIRILPAQPADPAVK
jgi:repressor LexA